MRMHKKPWAEPELAATSFFVEKPAECRGKWRDQFKLKEGPLHIEIGCGKCVQMASMAFANKDVRFIAIDEARKVLAVGCRVIRGMFGGDPDNVILTWADAQMLTDIFAPEDKAERIYISFPNPWTQRKKHHKRRLTHPRQLIQYRTILAPGGEIWFKTDDPELFAASVDYFKETGFEITYLTDDLHADGFEPNYQSEHERMFTAEGKSIHFLIAAMRELTPEQMELLPLKERPYHKNKEQEDE